MGDKLMELIKIFHKVELEGGQATLSATTHEGKTKLKLEIVSPPSATAPPSLPPAFGHRRRHRGARARALTSEQPPTKLRQPPVLRWPPLSAFFPRHLLNLGGVEWCLVWGGWSSRRSTTWTVLPPLLLLVHPLQHHREAGRQPAPKEKTSSLTWVNVTVTMAFSFLSCTKYRQQG